MIIINRIFYVLLALTLIRCGNPPRGGQTEEPQGRIFLSNSAELRDGLLKTIADDSGILMGGYILVIPVGIEPDDERIIYLQKKIAISLPNASHTLSLQRQDSLLPSERITVEGASLIFLVGGNLNRFMKLAERNGLAIAIRKAYEQGATIAGINQSACLAGEQIILLKQSATGEPDRDAPYRLIGGLGLVPGFITDIATVEEGSGGPVFPKKVVDAMEAGYIGVMPEGIVMIGDNSIRNLGNGDILLKNLGTVDWSTLKRSETMPMK